MGQYSLENYERYPTQKLRPENDAKRPVNRGSGEYVHVVRSWRSLEPGRAVWELEALEKELRPVPTALLEVGDEAPEWASSRETELFAACLRRVGSFLAEHDLWPAVLVRNEFRDLSVYRAYAGAFAGCRLLADIEDSESIEWMRVNRVPFGLYFNLGADTHMKISENLARYRLGLNWEQNPLYVNLNNTEDEFLRREAVRWHACCSNSDIGLGFSLAIRKVSLPEAVSRGGALPLRIWMLNSGTSPCYEALQMKIKLEWGGASTVLPLGWDSCSRPGDLIHNEIVKLPQLPAGEYRLSLGLFGRDGAAVNLQQTASARQGFYPLGSVEVDETDRPHYFKIWDDYYPEGYYPLEDPKAPAED